MVTATQRGGRSPASPRRFLSAGIASHLPRTQQKRARNAGKTAANIDASTAGTPTHASPLIRPVTFRCAELRVPQSLDSFSDAKPPAPHRIPNPRSASTRLSMETWRKARCGPIYPIALRHGILAAGVGNPSAKPNITAAACLHTIQNPIQSTSTAAHKQREQMPRRLDSFVKSAIAVCRQETFDCFL